MLPLLLLTQKFLGRMQEILFLVIDDDPEVRYTIGQYLISKGYEVIFAENGETGVKLAKKDSHLQLLWIYFYRIKMAGVF